MGFWFLAALIVLLLIAIPWWPHSRNWGYWPGGGLVIVLLAWLFIIWAGWTAFYLPWEAPRIAPGPVTPPPITGPATAPAAPATRR